MNRQVVGRMERLRWRVARRLLRWAGMLLARSGRELLVAQTSPRITIESAAWRGDVLVHLRVGKNDYARDINAQDAHGALIQLAAASYLADRTREGPS